MAGGLGAGSATARRPALVSNCVWPWEESSAAGRERLCGGPRRASASGPRVTLSRPQPSSALETFFDSLVTQAGIPNLFSMQMCGAGLPAAGSGANGGSLVLGGVEPSLYRGDIWYTPITEEWYYQVEILKLEIGGQSLSLDCREYNADKAIVDSGTTLLRLPQKVFDAVVEAVARASLIPEFSDGFWLGSQLACWTNSETPWSYFPKISIYLRDENASRSFRITILPQVPLGRPPRDGGTCCQHEPRAWPLLSGCLAQSQLLCPAAQVLDAHVCFFPGKRESRLVLCPDQALGPAVAAVGRWPAPGDFVLTGELE
ncbi:Beta-secretase 2 [Galemys pyrenaicus]|uniref:Beta-secretase 2 n=1 Tax=Galemys pyrenaicus TaxID=202257 RepID=A0A8J6AZ99_GALPY|nr:Beta-secretase 2 [Galemys pyrenaicus]